MKKILLSILICMIFICGCNANNKTNSSIQSNETKHYKIYMLDDLGGWRSDENSIYKTSDGGKTWVSSLSFNNQDIYNFRTEFIDDKNAYVEILQKVKNDTRTAYILATNNGGETWNKISTPDNLYGDFSFFDTEFGCIFIPGGAASGNFYVDVYTTNDGGDSWKLISKNLAIGGKPYKLIFTDSKNGFLFTNPGTGGRYDFMSTSNSGITWQRLSIDLYNKIDVNKKENYYCLLRPICINFKSKIALFTYKDSDVKYNYIFSFSQDGKTTEKIIDFFTDKIITDKNVSFINEDYGYCMATIDGKTSLYKYTIESGIFNKVSQEDWMDETIQIQFVSKTKGFILCKEALYISDNAGKSWNKIGIS